MLYDPTHRDYRVVKMFTRRPWHRDLPTWYPPIGKYNTILLRLRHLGLYHDEHLDFKDAMQKQRKLRGKGPPQKGRCSLRTLGNGTPPTPHPHLRFTFIHHIVSICCAALHCMLPFLSLCCHSNSCHSNEGMVDLASLSGISCFVSRHTSIMLPLNTS